MAVVDLDGTLHPDEEFAATHLEHLAAETDPATGQALIDEVRRILQRRHPVSLGSLYDPARDEVRPDGLRGDPSTTAWDGEPVLDARSWPEHAVYLGDPWQIIRAVAFHHRIPLHAQQAAFVRTRELMNDPATPLPRGGDARVAAELFAGFGLRMLVSNTPPSLAEPLVTRLGVDDAFDEIRLGADKPAGLAALLADLVDDAGLAPHRIVCAGDNLRNDIAPARQVGCRTVFVDPLGIATPDDADLVVRRLTDLARGPDQQAYPRRPAAP